MVNNELKELPKSWCIKRDLESSEILNEYFNKNCNPGGYKIINDNWYFHYPNLKNWTGFLNTYHLDSIINPNYTEISFEQFKKWVLKEETMDLLGEAKRRYPVGTHFYPAHVDTILPNLFCIVTEDSEFVFERNNIYSKINDKLWVNKGLKQYGNTNYNRTIYDNGKWAEIISKPEENKSLVGRYIKALVDKPHSGDVKKGEYGKITDNNFADFPSQKGYSLGSAIKNLNDSNPIYNNKYELMPEGFNPNVETPVEYVKCIKGKNGDIHNIVGKIYKVKSYNKKSEYLNLECYDNTILSINFNTPNPTNQTDYCIATKEEYDMQNQSKFEVGKWYTHPKWSSNSYIKFHSIRDYNSVIELERISQGIYKKEAIWSISYEHTLVPINLSEIQEFLPDGHVDKFPKEMNYKELQDKAWEIYKNVKIGDKYIDTNGNENTALKNATKSDSIDKYSFIYCGYGYLWEIKDGKELFGKLLTNDTVKTKKEILKYVECIESDTESFTVGRIYNWPYPIDNNGKVRRIGVLNGGLWGFKPSTKEAYDALFVVEEPEFVLPEKWAIKTTFENIDVLQNYLVKNKVDYPDYTEFWKCERGMYFHSEGHALGGHSSSLVYTGFTEITFKQFEKYVLKEDVKVLEEPKDKVLQYCHKNPSFIKQVKCAEGGIYQLSDKITPFDKDSPNKGKSFTITGFRWNNAKTEICAGTDHHKPYGIRLSKIELYIEPKKELSLLEQAKLRYPIGTKFNSTGGSKNCIISDKTEYHIDNDNDIRVSNVDGNWGGSVYSGKKNNWAEIVKLPKETEEEWIPLYKVGDTFKAKYEEKIIITEIGKSSEKAYKFNGNKGFDTEDFVKNKCTKIEEWIPKVDDWVTIENSKLLKSGCQGCPKGTFIVVENVPEFEIAGLSWSDENTFIIKTDVNRYKFWRISNIGVRKAEPHEIPKETTEIKRLKNNWEVGEIVRLIDGNYEGMNEGHIGIITSIESNTEFSVDNITGCDINFWEKVGATLYPRTPRDYHALENPLKIKSTINRIKSELIKVKQLKINN